jgi:hypothetical protein
MAWNGTGKNEPVGAQPQHVTIVVENHGVIGSQGEVRTWLTHEINYLARTGSLTQAVKEASGGR